MALARSREQVAAALMFAILGIGFVAAGPSPEDAFSEPRFYTPPWDLRTLPGVRERGSGWPRDALRLRLDKVLRGDPKENGADSVLLLLTLEEVDGSKLSKDRWCMKDPDAIAVPGFDGLRAWSNSVAQSCFQELNDSGEFTVTICPLPEGTRGIPRVVVDVPVSPVIGRGEMRFPVRRDKKLRVTFLDDILFAECDGRTICWGSESRARYRQPAAPESGIQGCLDSFEVRDALGDLVIEASWEGRSWGFTHFLEVEETRSAPRFPLRVDARWRRCAPTALCRFVLEDVAIPAE